MADFHGHLFLRAEARADACTAIRGQAFRAPFHVSKPYWDADTRTLLVQVVNPTAGILSGDRLESAVEVAAGAAMLLTTPSASRIFKMREGEANSTQRFVVESGAWLEVLPEPVVPHRGSVFHQRTELVVAEDGAAFYADLLLPGRVAHGEAWEWKKLVLELDVRRGGERLLHERFEQDGAGLKALAALAGAGEGEGACFGNAVVISPALASETSPAWRDQLHALQADGVWIGASQLRLGGGWSIKFVAPDGVKLKHTLAAIRRALVGVCPHLACDARKL
jgi:urease accessory protein